MSEETLDRSVKIQELPGSKHIRYRFKVPDDLDEPYADLCILTDGGCNTPDLRRLKVETKTNGDWVDITEDCVMDPENGNDSTTYKVVFPDLLQAGTRLRITIEFDEEFESGEYIVFRPSFDDGSVLSSLDTAAASTGELALGVFKRQARTLLAAELLGARGAATVGDRALGVLVRRAGFRGTLEKLGSVSSEFRDLLLTLDAQAKAGPDSRPRPKPRPKPKTPRRQGTAGRKGRGK